MSKFDVCHMWITESHVYGSPSSTCPQLLPSHPEVCKAPVPRGQSSTTKTAVLGRLGGSVVQCGDSHSVGTGPSASASSGTLSGVHIGGPTPGLLKKALRGCGSPDLCFKPGGSDTTQLRTVSLKQVPRLFLSLSLLPFRFVCVCVCMCKSDHLQVDFHVQQSMIL